MYLSLLIVKYLIVMMVTVGLFVMMVFVVVMVIVILVPNVVWVQYNIQVVVRDSFVWM